MGYCTGAQAAVFAPVAGANYSPKGDRRQMPLPCHAVGSPGSGQEFGSVWYGVSPMVSQSEEPLCWWAEEVCA